MLHRRIIAKSTETEIERVMLDREIASKMERLVQDTSIDIINVMPDYDKFGIYIIAQNEKKSKHKRLYVRLPHLCCTGDWVKYAIIQVKAQCEMYGLKYDM